MGGLFRNRIVGKGPIQMKHASEPVGKYWICSECADKKKWKAPEFKDTPEEFLSHQCAKAIRARNRINLLTERENNALYT